MKKLWTWVKADKFVRIPIIIIWIAVYTLLYFEYIHNYEGNDKILMALAILIVFGAVLLVLSVFIFWIIRVLRFINGRENSN